MTQLCLQSLVRRREGIAFLEPAAVEAATEPAHTLLGCSVREGMRQHTSLRPLLDRIVADLVGCAHRLLDIAAVEVALVVLRPDAGEKIRLQLLANRD